MSHLKCWRTHMRENQEGIKLQKLNVSVRQEIEQGVTCNQGLSGNQTGDSGNMVCVLTTRPPGCTYFVRLESFHLHINDRRLESSLSSRAGVWLYCSCTKRPLQFSILEHVSIISKCENEWQLPFISACTVSKNGPLFPLSAQNY